MTLKDSLSKLSLSRIRQLVAKYNKHLKITGHSKLGKNELISHILKKSNLNLQLINRLTNEALLHGRAQSREPKKRQAVEEPAKSNTNLFSTIGNLLLKQGFPMPQITEPEVRQKKRPPPLGPDDILIQPPTRPDPPPPPTTKDPPEKIEIKKEKKRPGGLDLSGKDKFDRENLPPNPTNTSVAVSP